mmetsp:Transcript_34464/g.67420  ORF Transcript_34464/g.67420 Transcript_34464/m.67420 type:complete len:289 (+) Transcript_34464:64-930(+)|eukprot:CAMPEP_0173392760 /NCGR_PEP_ID=MMETSP1356-20130122/21049_1 /TAXON_ID=77927 ORGANISM="Hemiselmis virescens, Strain PCC157" /NCGR_SAMPLE_ID=MMETSP1356 /ASSEMBLY_ACC=CAM_ASM_000847 /LENGTH=288 /DNA_ID=CAMNT_0014350649 /DNA_START=63 /DNA_END=929 /DNA_ORIENTATION=-
MNESSQTAQSYYDSEDAYTFYQHVWGGEAIHIGLYDEVPRSGEGVDADIEWSKAAARLSTQQLFTKVPEQTLQAGINVCDLGAAYGEAARHCAQKFGCTVLCVEVSKKENDFNRKRTAEAGLQDKVMIPKELSFFDTEADASSMDLVVSQDSLLHAGAERHKVIQEASRILKKGGYLVFTDIMQTDGCDPSVLASTGVLKRIHLESMGSPGVYRKHAEDCGLKFVKFEDRTPCLMSHYATVRSILKAKRSGLSCSAQFVDNMLGGLSAWVAAGETGSLCWGFLVFQKE